MTIQSKFNSTETGENKTLRAYPDTDSSYLICPHCFLFNPVSELQAVYNIISCIYVLMNVQGHAALYSTR